jgi:hypothetical protein
MADAKKITQEELEAVRLAVSNFNRAKAALGDLEFDKSKLLVQVTELEGALQVEQKKLEDTYGSITVNLETGEYEEAAEEAKMEVVEE